MLESDKDGPWTVSTLKQYFEQMHRDRDTALKIAVTELDRRLAILNDSYARAKDKERDFYSREQHDTFAKTVDQRLDQLHGELETLRRPQWTVWFAAATLFMSVTGVLWYFAMQPVQIDMLHLKDRDEAAVEQIKMTNTRIDKLYELYRDLQSQHAEALRKLNGMKKGP